MYNWVHGFYYMNRVIATWSKGWDPCWSGYGVVKTTIRKPLSKVRRVIHWSCDRRGGFVPISPPFNTQFILSLYISIYLKAMSFRFSFCLCLCQSCIQFLIPCLRVYIIVSKFGTFSMHLKYSIVHTASAKRE